MHKIGRRKRTIIWVIAAVLFLFVCYTIVSSILVTQKCKWLVVSVNDACGVYDEELSEQIYKIADPAIIRKLEFHSNNNEYDSKVWESIDEWRASWYDCEYRIGGFKGIVLANKALVFYNYSFETRETSSNEIICGSKDIPCTLKLSLTTSGWKIVGQHEPP